MYYSLANNKLKKLAAELGLHKSKVRSFDLPAGKHCHQAKDCRCMVVPNNEGKYELLSFPETTVRCYAASIELARPNVRRIHEYNLEQVLKYSKDVAEVADLFEKTIPRNLKVLRLHASGDFVSKTYMWGMLKFARVNPDIEIYGYTKCVRWWRESLDRGYVPSNVRFVMSKGGRQDDLIGDLPFAQVIYNPGEADQLGLPINTTDIQAYRGESSALLIHGVQAPGSYAGKCVRRWREYKTPKSLVS